MFVKYPGKVTYEALDGTIFQALELSSLVLWFTMGLRSPRIIRTASLGNEMTEDIRNSTS